MRFLKLASNLFGQRGDGSFIWPYWIDVSVDGPEVKVASRRPELDPDLSEPVDMLLESGEQLTGGGDMNTVAELDEVAGLGIDDE